MKHRTRLLVLIGLGLLLVLAAGGLLLIRSGKEAPNSSTTTTLKQFRDDKQRVGFSFPSEANQLGLTTEDTDDKFLFRASRDDDLPYLITLRYEEGLRTASQLSRTSTIELLLTNTDKAFPSRYPGYKKLSERRFEQGGKQAAEIDFTYKGLDGQEARQKLYIFLRDENTAYYLSLQSKEADISHLNDTFSDVAKSFQL